MMFTTAYNWHTMPDVHCSLSQIPSKRPDFYSSKRMFPACLKARLAASRRTLACASSWPASLSLASPEASNSPAQPHAVGLFFGLSSLPPILSLTLPLCRRLSSTVGSTTGVMGAGSGPPPRVGLGTSASRRRRAWGRPE